MSNRKTNFFINLFFIIYFCGLCSKNLYNSPEIGIVDIEDENKNNMCMMSEKIQHDFVLDLNRTQIIYFNILCKYFYDNAVASEIASFLPSDFEQKNNSFVGHKRWYEKTF